MLGVDLLEADVAVYIFIIAVEGRDEIGEPFFEILQLLFFHIIIPGLSWLLLDLSH